MSQPLWNDEPERPVQHLRVIDLTVMLPGPYVTRLLAQYGAEVVKIENLPNGDPLRTLPNSAAFELLNQGKRSLALDLKSEEGARMVREMTGEADIFIENFREGVMDRLGLGYAELSEVNPDLLYVSLRGNSGKNSTLAAHDLNFIAASGCGEWFLENGNPNYSTMFGDIVGGALVPLTKILMHTANPDRRGMHLISYMDEGFRSLYLLRAFDSVKAEEVAPELRENFGTHRSLDGSFPHSRYYQCRDGTWVSLNAIQQKHWITFCEVVDKPEWRERMWDKTLVPDVEKLFLDAPSNYWEALPGNRDLCLFRVVPWNEHLTFSQARPQLASDPFTWAGFLPRNSITAAPGLGADSFSVLKAHGVSNKDFAAWCERGIVKQIEK